MAKEEYSYGPNTGMYPTVGPFAGDSVTIFDNNSIPSDMQVDLTDDPFNSDSEIAKKVKNSVAYQQAIRF